jgi:hypothetical protein
MKENGGLVPATPNRTGCGAVEIASWSGTVFSRDLSPFSSSGKAARGLRPLPFPG